MDREKAMLKRVIALGQMMTEMKDTDMLMERILTEARKLSNCDAGSIYRSEGKELLFSYTQNDTQQKALPPGKKLPYSAFRMPIDENSIAGFAAFHNTTLNVADAYNLDQSLPYTFNPAYDLLMGYHTGSMLTIPLQTTSGKVIGVLQLINALDAAGEITVFNQEDLPFIDFFANTAAVALERADMTRLIILRMISMAEMRDPTETGAHVNRVGAYAAEIYEAWASKREIPETEMQHNKDLLRVAAMLHDVGKVGIADAILKKPDKLTEEEYDTMKTHPYIGACLFRDSASELDTMSMEIAIGHHERWDGRGYPGYIDMADGKPLPGKMLPDGKALGKTGEETPLWARIVAIADVYDALSTRRYYKEPWTQDDVFDELKRSSGSHFDPELIEIFVFIRDAVQVIRQKYPDRQD
ncbi:MAG: HD domain-containing protein [Candidatus Cloacimonetes bacterium]|nr:HD domain-containing protein [Candidatus Cloacimonadota bacterium]MDY0172560.1 HD domain-containing protein [Candidatus Cloacimonadaceae bacterium]